MCASYGLDPRFKDTQAILASDQQLLDDLRSWAIQNNGKTLLPTGINLRNLNPIVQERDGARTVELAWWGYLINGEPAKFPSINTRSERLIAKPGALRGRAIVPATMWFEMQKPSRQWFRFHESDNELLAMAAVTQPGRTIDGKLFTCYSIVMRPATDPLASIHDRTPLLLPAEFVSEWLTGDAEGGQLVEAAAAASERVLHDVASEPIVKRP